MNVQITHEIPINSKKTAGIIIIGNGTNLTSFSSCGKRVSSQEKSEWHCKEKKDIHKTYELHILMKYLTRIATLT